MNLFKRHFSKAGFTMLEMVVVLFVAGLGLMAILSLSVNSLRVQSLGRNSVTANLLAEDGLELFKEVLLANYLADAPNSIPVDWLDNVDLGGGNNFRIDYLSGTPEPYDGSEDFYKFYNDSNSFYLHDDSYSETVFRRVLRITDNSDYLADSIKVECEVSWDEKGQSYYYTLVSYFYDYKQL
jgi:prepilin-type N-terminal cleavage/methylation domain-containing protein